MARKKDPPKPLLSLRHDFVASLENLCNECLLMLQMAESVAQHDGLSPRIREMLIERTKALRAAMLSED